MLGGMVDPETPNELEIELGHTDLEDAPPSKVLPIQALLHRRRFSVLQVLAAALIAALVGIVGTRIALHPSTYITPAPVSASKTSAPKPVPSSTYRRPFNPQEQVFLGQLQPAGDELAEAIADSIRPPYDEPGWQPTYVAHGSLALPSKPLSKPITILMPPGAKWLSGPLNNIQLVFPEVTLFHDPALQWEHGYRVYNPLCKESNVEVVEDLCDHPGKQVTPQVFDTSHMRYVPEDQWGQQFPDQEYVSTIGQGNEDVYIATGPVTLKADKGAPDRSPIIVLDIDKGAKVVGGQLGWSTVMTLDDYGQDGSYEFDLMRDPVYLAARKSYADFYCRNFSTEVQRAYYPGACT